MYRPVRITPPAEAPVSVDDAKAFLREDGAEQDGLIEALIASAVDHLDGRSGILGRCMVTQVWQFRSDTFRRCWQLDMPGATAAAVRYFDADGEAQDVPADAFELRETRRGTCIVFGSGVPTGSWYGPIVADVTFGTAAQDVAPALVQAVRMLVAHWYAHREAVVTGSVAQLPLGVSALVAPYRWMSV